MFSSGSSVLVPPIDGQAHGNVDGQLHDSIVAPGAVAINTWSRGPILVGMVMLVPVESQKIFLCRNEKDFLYKERKN